MAATDSAGSAESSSAGRPDSRPVSFHWLVRILQRAGIPGHDTLDVPAITATVDAWAVVSRALGLSQAEIAELVAKYFRLEVAALADADPAATALIPAAMARKHHVLPLRHDSQRVWVATADPTDVEAEKALGFATGRTPVFQVAAPTEIQGLLDGRFTPERAVETLLETLQGEDDADAVTLVEEMGPEAVTEHDVESTPVVKLTNLILRDGIGAGASDIHIEPGRRTGVVRYRVDGVLRKHMDVPISALNRVISRIKILAQLDIADRLRPQDGKARVKIGERAYDLRVSTLPSSGAEKCVIRVLDSAAEVTLDDLNITAPELERLRSLLTNRAGILVVTGPTGSGKTTTLYGALRELADGQVNIMTVEDPIEYDMPEISQTQVETKQGMTFGAALRAILRQDPDIILVGEIRDKETAEVASQAAMTGHLVLTTVHANDAVSAIQRLGDMGLQYSTIAQALRGALAQRLLRKVCSSCAEPVGDVLTPEEQGLAERHGTQPAVRAVGCLECGFTGYRGRLPVCEVVINEPRFAEAVELRKGWATLTQVATKGGMRPMGTVAQDWVRSGETTLVEVERVLGHEAEDQSEDAGGVSPRILLVDDDPAELLLGRTLLEREGFEVVEAADGNKALDLLRADPNYSLCVLDLMMPGIDGREVLARIRDSVETVALPVVIRTGSEDEKTELELLDAGADDYLSKPIDPDRFIARVRAILRRSFV